MRKTGSRRANHRRPGQAEAGRTSKTSAASSGSAESTFFRWKKQYGDLGVGELREMRRLRDENRGLNAWPSGRRPNFDSIIRRSPRTLRIPAGSDSSLTIWT